MFPATMQPKVLFGVLAYQIFQCRRIALRHGFDSVGSVLVFFGKDHILHHRMILHWLVNPDSGEDHDRHTMLQGQKRNRFVRRSRPIEKVHI